MPETPHPFLKNDAGSPYKKGDECILLFLGLNEILVEQGLISPGCFIVTVSQVQVWAS
jgi:hypothetical protein